MTRFIPVLLAVGLFSTSPALAQFGSPWIGFERSGTSLPSGATVSDDLHETDLDWGDVDLDGDVDLVVARKEPWTTTGGRSNVLLMNEGGILVDRTASLATASDVAGDRGFLTPTNDRDVVLADLNGDGYPEIITATDRSPGKAKFISHPRIYLNLGEVGGVWQGFRLEDSRMPELLHLGSGLPKLPLFAAIDAADLDNDGDVDLYLADHDTALNLFGALQSPAEDLDDRILLNDGNGYFTDSSSVSASPDILFSGFCNSVELVDVNGDGAIDILKQTTYQNPSILSIAYNDPANPGVFSDLFTATPPRPYFVNTGDLNSDGNLDLAMTSNDNDYVMLNQGSLTNGHVDWSAPIETQLLFGSEPLHQGFPYSYSSNNLLVDLDGDGFDEVLVADVDVEITQYKEGFRLHFYHNQGGLPGAATVDLVEERGSLSDSSWIGAPGLHAEDLRWTHDVAVFDVNGDGKKDLVLSRLEGTQVWLQTNQPTCQASLGFGTGIVLEICGGDLSSSNAAELIVRDATPSAPLYLALGTGANPTPLAGLGVTLVPSPVSNLLTFQADALGVFALEVPGGLGLQTIFAQAFQLGSSGTSLQSSNALQIELLP